MSTIAMASHGQPSRKHPSGPLLRHFLHPMHKIGSTAMRPNGVLSSSGTQNMQSSTGQYSTHAGEPAQPVQHSVITASSLGFFLRGVVRPWTWAPTSFRREPSPQLWSLRVQQAWPELYPGFKNLQHYL